MVKKSSFLEKLFSRKKSAARNTGSDDRGRVSPRIDAGREAGGRSSLRSSDRLGSKAVPGTDRIREPERLPASRASKSAKAQESKGAKEKGAKAQDARPRVIEARKLPQGGDAAPSAAKPAPKSASPRPVARQVSKAVSQTRRSAETPGNAHDKVVHAPKPAPSSGGGVTRILGGKSREDAAQALTEGFRELGSLLHGIHERMDSQGRQSSQLNENFAGLPDMAKAQVDFMATVSQQLVEQREKTGELLEKLGGLPDLLDGIHKTLERTAAVEERTEKNLRDFRTTMDRIHTSIGELSAQNTAAMSKATESLERTNSRTTKVFEDTQQKAYETFQRSQEQGIAELSKVVERTSRSSRAITFMLALLCIAVVVLTVVLLQR